MKKLLGIAGAMVLFCGVSYAATTTTASWTENTTLHSNTTVSAGAVATDDIDLANLGYDVVSITIEVDFGGTPDGDAEIGIYSSNDSGTNDDTVAVSCMTITNSASTTHRKTIVIQDLPYIAVKLHNKDTTDGLGYTSWYSGRKWNSQ